MTSLTFVYFHYGNAVSMMIMMIIVMWSFHRASPLHFEVCRRIAITGSQPRVHPLMMPIKDIDDILQVHAVGYWLSGKRQIVGWGVRVAMSTLHLARSRSMARDVRVQINAVY